MLFEGGRPSSAAGELLTPPACFSRLFVHFAPLLLELGAAVPVRGLFVLRSEVAEFDVGPAAGCLCMRMPRRQRMRRVPDLPLKVA